MPAKNDNKRLLVVDDQVEITDLIREIAGAEGCEVHAIQLTEADPYSQLDDDIQALAMEIDRALGAPDPARPEPSHIESEASDE